MTGRRTSSSRTPAAVSAPAPATAARRRAHRVVIVAYPPVQILDVTGPLEVFASANSVAERAGQRAPYSLELAAPRAGPVATTCGVPLLASRALDDPALRADTLLVAGGPGARDCVDDAQAVRTLARLLRRVARAGSICTGSFALAATGALDDRRATTHWARFDEFARRFPRVTIDRDALFVADGRFQTSAGISAGIDSALALVEADLGRPVALQVARELVVFLKRPGGQSQFSAQMASEAAAADPDRFAALTRWMAAHLSSDLSAEALAERVAMSPRNFARRFVEAMRVPPAKYVQRLRVEAARRMLTDGRQPVARVAARCGFPSAEAMRAAFQRTLNVAPSEFRARFSSAGAA